MDPFQQMLGKYETMKLTHNFLQHFNSQRVHCRKIMQILRVTTLSHFFNHDEICAVVPVELNLCGL